MSHLSPSPTPNPTRIPSPSAYSSSPTPDYANSKIPSTPSRSGMRRSLVNEEEDGGRNSREAIKEGTVTQTRKKLQTKSALPSSPPSLHPSYTTTDLLAAIKPHESALHEIFNLYVSPTSTSTPIPYLKFNELLLLCTDYNFLSDDTSSTQFYPLTKEFLKCEYEARCKAPDSLLFPGFLQLLIPLSLRTHEQIYAGLSDEMKIGRERDEREQVLEFIGISLGIQAIPSKDTTVSSPKPTDAKPLVAPSPPANKVQMPKTVAASGAIKPIAAAAATVTKGEKLVAKGKPSVKAFKAAMKGKDVKIVTKKDVKKEEKEKTIPTPAAPPVEVASPFAVEPEVEAEPAEAEEETEAEEEEAGEAAAEEGETEAEEEGEPEAEKAEEAEQEVSEPAEQEEQEEQAEEGELQQPEANDDDEAPVEHPEPEPESAPPQQVEEEYEDDTIAPEEMEADGQQSEAQSPSPLPALSTSFSFSVPTSPSPLSSLAPLSPINPLHAKKRQLPKPIHHASHELLDRIDSTIERMMKPGAYDGLRGSPSLAKQLSPLISLPRRSQQQPQATQSPPLLVSPAKPTLAPLHTSSHPTLPSTTTQATTLQPLTKTRQPQQRSHTAVGGMLPRLQPLQPVNTQISQQGGETKYKNKSIQHEPSTAIDDYRPKAKQNKQHKVPPQSSPNPQTTSHKLSKQEAMEMKLEHELSSLDIRLYKHAGIGQGPNKKGKKNKEGKREKGFCEKASKTKERSDKSDKKDKIKPDALLPQLGIHKKAPHHDKLVIERNNSSNSHEEKESQMEMNKKERRKIKKAKAKREEEARERLERERVEQKEEMVYTEPKQKKKKRMAQFPLPLAYNEAPPSHRLQHEKAQAHAALQFPLQQHELQSDYSQQRQPPSGHYPPQQYAQHYPPQQQAYQVPYQQQPQQGMYPPQHYQGHYPPYQNDYYPPPQQHQQQQQQQYTPQQHYATPYTQPQSAHLVPPQLPLHPPQQQQQQQPSPQQQSGSPYFPPYVPPTNYTYQPTQLHNLS